MDAEDTVTLAMVLATAYLLGSIPTAYIVVHRVTGRDIRSIGNGNPGTMNVWDSVGLKPAIVVGVGDVGKGMAAVGFAYWTGLGDGPAVLAGLMAVAGHDFSVFLRFDGGNGTAPAIGALFALVPGAALPLTPVAIAIFAVTRNKRIAGLIALSALPALAYYLDYSDVTVIGVFAILAVVAAKIVRFEGFTPQRTKPPQ